MNAPMAIDLDFINDSVDPSDSDDAYADLFILNFTPFSLVNFIQDLIWGNFLF